MKIACIGNAVYDCIVSGDFFLTEGLKHSYYDVVFSPGGPASNAASVLAKYGNNVDFYGQVGNDTNGKIIRDEMSLEKINIEYLNLSNNTMTPFGFIIINTKNNTRTICSLRAKEDYKGAKIEDVKFKENYYDYILTDGKYVEDTLDLINKNPNAIKIIDAGRVNSGVLKLCKQMDYIICSEEFANRVTGGKINYDYDNNVRIYEALESFYPNAKGITITIGARGYICKKDNQVIINPAYESGLETIDTNGAGDIFHGAFTHALANGYNYYDSLEFANITASLSTTKKGSRKAVPELEEVEKIIKKQEKILVRKK